VSERNTLIHDMLPAFDSGPDESCQRLSGGDATNHCMQLTPQTVIKFACANFPPASD